MQMTKSCSSDKNRARSKDLRPPRAHQRRTRQRMAHQHRVVPRRIQPPVHRVMQRRTSPASARSPATGASGEHKIALVRGLQRAAFPLAGAARRHRFGVSHYTLLCRKRRPSSVPANVCPFAASIAWSRSARISRMSSMPTDSRTSSGVTPVPACSSTDKLLVRGRRRDESPATWHRRYSPPARTAPASRSASSPPRSRP